MFDLDKWQEIYLTLSRNKLRTLLTAFGVFWGIFMLLVMLGAGNGLQNGVNEGFSGWASNSFFVWSQTTTKEYMGFKPGRNCQLTNDDARAIKTTVADVDIVAPRHRLGDYGGGNEVIRGIKKGNFKVSGDYPEYAKIETYRFEKGRFINQSDILQKRKVAVIGQKVYEVLFEKDENPIGKFIQVNEVNFKVIGLLQKPTRQGDEQMEAVMIPFSTFQYTFNMGDKIGWLGITVQPNVKAEVVQERVLTLLRNRHKVHPDDKQAFGAWNMQKEFEQMTNLFTGIKGLSWFVGILTLLAGVIGVSNIMLIIIKERTREIGVRRALGATPFAIVSQIIMESVVLTTFAGYFGIVAGIGLLELISNAIDSAPPSPDGSFFKHPGVDLSIALIALGVLIVFGMLAGLIPARRALSIKPVEALRAE